MQRFPSHASGVFLFLVILLPVSAVNLSPNISPEYADVLAFHSIDDAWLVLYEGQNALQAGRYEEALSAYTNATEIDPSLMEAWYLKAYTLTKLNRSVEALAAVDRALALDSTDRDSNNLKADILDSLGRRSEAARYRVTPSAPASIPVTEPTKAPLHVPILLWGIAGGHGPWVDLRPQGDAGCTMKNTEWKWVWVCLALALVFFVLAFVAGGLLDGMSSGYAMMLVFFFMLLCSLAVAGLFVMRARAMDEILAGKDLLAYWEYPADETARNAGREYAEYRAKNRLLLYFIGGLLVIAMILVVIFGEEDGVTTAGMLFVVLIIVAIASVVAPRFGYRKAIAAPREAYITDRGIIYAGTTYPFKSFLMRMTKVQFENATAKRPALLIFTFFSWSVCM